MDGWLCGSNYGLISNFPLQNADFKNKGIHGLFFAFPGSVLKKFQFPHPRICSPDQPSLEDWLSGFFAGRTGSLCLNAQDLEMLSVEVLDRPRIASGPGFLQIHPDGPSGYHPDLPAVETLVDDHRLLPKHRGKAADEGQSQGQDLYPQREQPITTAFVVIPGKARVTTFYEIIPQHTSSKRR